MSAFLDTLEVTEISPKIFAIADHPLRYLSDLAKRTFTVPVGFFTDFYSVPFWMPTIYVLVATLCDRSPAALHDWLYYAAITDRETADKILREAMQAKGVPAWKCASVYWTLRAGGWSAWNGHRKIGDPIAGKFADSPDILWLKETHL
jgi:hypothetical protein